MVEVAFMHALTEQQHLLLGHLLLGHLLRNINRRTVNLTTMETSPIATLSAELRNQIYHLVLTHAEPIIISSSLNGDKIWSQVARQHELLALTRTCRTIREESIKIFYAVNTFKHLPRLHGPRTQELVRGFDNRIGREIAAVINKVVVMPLEIHKTPSPFNEFGLGGGDGVIIYNAKKLIDLASKDNSRSYRLQCTFHCKRDTKSGTGELLWEDDVFFDVPDFVMGCKQARADIRRKIETANDPVARVCLSKMGKKIAGWQEIYMYGLDNYLIIS